ncbi:MAG: hypothetical protein IKQ75_03345 [Bacteroidales bacterium]|nr:hypothetical protein [Bacteroidales bacterium]MBR6160884.1 hypothetical protein [Bacteroidales bacterium]
MKKLTFLLVGLMISTTLFSQSCLDDVWQCLRNNQAPKAKKFIEECMAAYPDNAQVWLMKGNVYVNLYNSDQKKLNADPNYTPRYPDALLIANEAFIKALELDPKVQPKTGMLGAIDGQRLCADPFNEMGAKYAKMNDFENALKYYSLAAKNYELGKNKQNASAMYYQMAVIYFGQGNQAEGKNMLLKSVSTFPTLHPAIYTTLYDLYKSEKDTVNCGNILKKGLTAFPDNEDLMSTQIDYYDMTGQSDKVLALCDSMLAKKPGDLTVAANCANYMSNAKYFTKAEEILTGLLAEHPNDFQLNFQMAYRYTMEVVEYEDKIDAAIKAKQYAEVNPLKAAEKDILQKAHDWSQKAYEIDPNNRQNNITLQQLKVKLLLPVPEELKAKVDSYRHQN